MPENPQVICWDSSAFLSYVNEVPDRIQTLETLLERSASGEVDLYTSAISHVEVAFGASEQLRGRLDLEIERRIDSLWADSNVVVAVEYQSLIGRVARDMMREAVTRGWGLKPLDAIHLATAQWLFNTGTEIEEFQTYDVRLTRYASIVDFRICEPYNPQPKMI